MIQNTYKGELPVYYVPPKPKKIIFTERDLYNADCFSFGSIIGQITNKSSNAYALLPNLEKQYGQNSPEVQLTVSRLKQCCKAQSSQIDKAKIGQEVKGIPSIWNDRQKISDEDSFEVKSQKEFANHILLNRHPYFFIYRYAETRAKYKNYVKNADTSCRIKFGKSLSELETQKCYSDDEKNFLLNYQEFMPVTISDSPMNLLCRYIESIQFQVNQKVKTPLDLESAEIYKCHDTVYTKEIKAKIIKVLKGHMKSIHAGLSTGFLYEDECADQDAVSSYLEYLEVIEADFLKVSSNVYEIVNVLVDYCYTESPKSNKKILWDIFGKYLWQNAKRNIGNKSFWYPIPSDNGNISYLGKRYQMQEIFFDEVKK